MIDLRHRTAVAARTFRISNLAAASILALTVAGAAGAQTASAPAAPGDMAQADTGGIADIIVTAQRRQESLQNVPIAVTAATADMLQARGVQNTREMIAAIPSVTVFSTAGYFQPRIRGIGNTAVGAGFEGGVAVYVDGVYQAAPQANLFSLANIDRIEVLKGPQGTLFGRNTTGGLIQIITRDPSETFGGTASVTAANYQDFTGDLYVTGRLTEGAAINFVAHGEAMGKGWGKNFFTGQDVYRVNHDIALRSTLLLTPGPDTKIKISGDYGSRRGTQTAGTKLAPGTGFPFPGLVQPTGTYNLNEDVQPDARVKTYGASGQLTQELGFASLVNITAYRKANYHLIFDGDISNIKLIDIDITQRDRQFSEELQLASNPSSPIKWVIGGFYFDASSRFAPNSVAFGGFLRRATPLGTLIASTTRDGLGTRSLAAYGQATAPLGDIVNLTLGIRYTHERKNITDITTGNFFLGVPAPVTGTAPNRTVTYNRPTWRVALDHRFSPELMVYASYNRGFKSGGFNGQFPTDAPFQPEKIDAYEAGIKSDLFDRHLRINASGFYYKYSNIQVSRFIGSQTSYYNGAAARLYGLDVDFEARLTPEFSLSGGFTLVHDRFRDFPNAVISTQVPTGIVITTGSAKGNRLPLTADFSGTISVNYKTDVHFADLVLDMSYNYNDGYYTQPDNILRQPSYDLLSAGAGLNFKNGINARVWMRNILNTKVFSTLQAGSFDSNAGYQAPRTYGITLGYKF